jgi:multiple antibiotic resistance protein
MTLSEYAGLAVPMLARPATISTVILLEAQTASWAHRSVLLACVVLVDLASYIHLTLGASGAKWMSPLAEKIMTRLLDGAATGCTCGTILVQWTKGEQGLLGR